MKDNMTLATILITGGTGFIGSRIAEALSASGMMVRAGTRRTGSNDARSCPCDLDHPQELGAALSEAKVVVHAAYGDDKAMLQQCANLLQAMEAEGVESLIFLSSIAVYGAQTGRVGEDAPLSALDAYAAAKMECEAMIRKWATGEERRAVILRPGIVYGEGSPFWDVKLSERIRWGVWGTFGEAGNGIAPLVHVDDVAGTVARAVDRLLSADRPDLPRAAAINVCGPDKVTWNRYFLALAEKLHAPALETIGSNTLALRQLLAVPAKVALRLGFARAYAMSLAPTPGEIALFSRKADYRTDTSGNLLQFTPSIELRDGLHLNRCREAQEASLSVQ